MLFLFLRNLRLSLLIITTQLFSACEFTFLSCEWWKQETVTLSLCQVSTTTYHKTIYFTFHYPRHKSRCTCLFAYFNLVSFDLNHRWVGKKRIFSLVIFVYGRHCIFLNAHAIYWWGKAYSYHTGTGHCQY